MPASPRRAAMVSMGRKSCVFSSRRASATWPMLPAPERWPARYRSAERTSHRIAPREDAFATNAASTIEPLSAACASPANAKRKSARARRAIGSLLDEASQIVAPERLGDPDLLVVEEGIELLPLHARVLEERARLLDDVVVRAREGAEVGRRLGKLAREPVLQLERRDADREERTPRGAHGDVELLLLHAAARHPRGLHAAPAPHGR